MYFKKNNNNFRKHENEITMSEFEIMIYNKGIDKGIELIKNEKNKEEKKKV